MEKDMGIVGRKEGEGKIEGTEGEVQVEEKEGEVQVEEKEDEGKIEVTEGEVHVEVTEGEVQVEEKEGEVHVEEKEGEGKIEVTEGEVKVKEKEGEVKVKEKEGEVKVKEKEGEVKGEGEIAVLENPIPAENAPASDRPRLLRGASYLSVLLGFEKAILPFVNMATFVLHADCNKKEGRPTVFRNMCEKLMLGLLDRPRFLRMEVVLKVDELQVFCRAVSEGWRLWRGEEWVGIQQMLEYLSNYTLREDIKRIEVSFLLTLKEIATHEWKDDNEGGLLLAAKAKKIIFLNKTSIPEEKEVPTPQDCVVPLSALEICAGVDCLEIETSTGTFPRCGKCKKVAYHSKECQTKAWKAGHKKACKNTV